MRAQPSQQAQAQRLNNNPSPIPVEAKSSRNAALIPSASVIPPSLAAQLQSKQQAYTGAPLNLVPKINLAQLKNPALQAQGDLEQKPKLLRVIASAQTQRLPQQQTKPAQLKPLDNFIFSSSPMLGNQSARPQNMFEQKSLQVKFLEQENLQFQQKVRDLQETLKINKELIGNLLGGSESSESAVVKSLRAQVEQVVQREKKQVEIIEQMQGKQLISEQIIANLREREDEANAMADEQKKTLTDKLDKKEYALQMCEMKLATYEKFIQRKAVHDADCRALMFKFRLSSNLATDNVDDMFLSNDYDDEDDERDSRIVEAMNQKRDDATTTEKVSNVVDENMKMKEELKGCHLEINRLMKIVQGKEKEMYEFELLGEENEESLLDKEQLKFLQQLSPKDYRERLELLLSDTQAQLKQTLKESKSLKQENFTLKDSTDSYLLLIQKLNTALTKASARLYILEDSVKEIFEKFQEGPLSEAHELLKELYDSIPKNSTVVNIQIEPQIRELMQKVKVQQATNGEVEFGDDVGNLSSIMITPEELQNTLYGTNTFSVRGSAMKPHMQTGQLNQSAFSFAQAFASKI
ncbi:hypothetical protein FGO68_gene13382 [Halteria grandinella]|uniref:Uncharacterized protein n=1 Tax=Halteria grandinella TaxID=5974 RepID=A0A8J8NUZ9_HALGN|nr:hypothetical protein FGO68_gene13382 [Halteria grandinella]